MRVAVVGAGLAGLSCACELVDAGHDVVVLESRPWAGGKTYSFAEADGGDAIDNGQHIAMRCTTAYLGFLSKIGTRHLIDLQPRLRVPVIDAASRMAVLGASALPAPLHLLPSFARYRHLPPAERLRVARGMAAVARLPAAGRGRSEGTTFAGWLRAHGQSERAIRELWDLVIVPTLNCRSDRASATAALFVLREGFLQSTTSAAIGVPRAGLSALHVDPAIAYVRARGGEVRTRAQVRSLCGDVDVIEAVLLDDGSRVECDSCVVATPPDAALDLLPRVPELAALRAGLAAFDFAPIVNLHLWFDRPVAPWPFAAFTGGELQWAFAHPPGAAREQRLVLSLSAAEAYIDLDRPAIVERMLAGLWRALPSVRAARLLRSTVIKEPRATFVPAPGLRRPPNRTAIPNLVLAGAHTDTGWPATMESAVRSGVAAASAVNRLPARPREGARVAVA